MKKKTLLTAALASLFTLSICSCSVLANTPAGEADTVKPEKTCGPEYIKDMDITYDCLMKVKPILRNKINFSVADATEKCKVVKPDNTIILARNFWPYLKGEDKRIKLANELYKNLGENSVVVVGSFDDTSGAFASKNLCDSGFVCNPEIYTIFEKNTVPYSQYYIN